MQNSQTSSTSAKETSNEVDPLGRYVHSNHVVYESLVAYVRGDAPLKDASNERIRALQEAKAADAYVSFWRFRYETALTFFEGRPYRPRNDSARPYSPHPQAQLDAIRCANDDAFTLFSKDPVAEHQAKRQLEALRSAAEHRVQIDQSQFDALRKAWEAEQRAGVPLQGNDDRIGAFRYVGQNNFSKALRITNPFGVVRQDPDAVIRITDLDLDV